MKRAWLVAVLLGLAVPAAADDAADCSSNTLSPQDSVRGCTNWLKGSLSASQQAVAYTNRANSHKKLGDLDAALADYDRAIKAKPDYGNAYNGRATVHYGRRDFDRALADYDAAIRANPNDPIPYKNRGSVHRMKGDTDRALADEEKAISLKPDYGEAYIERGNLHFDKGRTDRAIADYTKAISLGSSEIDLAYGNRALAYEDKKDLDRALADYDAAIRANPASTAYGRRAVLRVGKGQYALALADYNEAIRQTPRSASILFARGRVRLYLGAPAEAQADLRMAVELDPASAYVVLWLELIERRNRLPGRIAERAPKLKYEAANGWPRPLVRFFAGEIGEAALFAATGDPDALTQRGQVCEAHFYVAELLLARSDQAGAAEHFSAVEADCPRGFIEYEAALAELGFLAFNPRQAR